MAIREIRLFGDPVLKTTCKAVGDIDRQTRAHLEDLIDTVKLPGRAGVASNQIGHTLRAFSVNVDGKVRVFINPEITEYHGEPEEMGEGCLSLPDLWFQVSRYPRVTMRAQDGDGSEVTVRAEGLLAQALQHECDHLDGMLYIDRLNQPQRSEALRLIRRSDWF